MMNINDTDKSTWKTVRFGDMVHHISERVQPDDVTVDRYVGLEHLDPESLKIRRWGSPDEVGATKLRFYPGDIIFGKRRFYQRKLAVADFDGICSAHAMVLRAKPKVVLPEFLPFFMQSESFFERAMSISVGSLSPTINWSTLKRQEFALPPLDEQRRVAEVLTAVEDTAVMFTEANSQARKLKQVALRQLTLKGIGNYNFVETKIGQLPAHWKLKTVGDVITVNQYGLSKRADDKSRYPIFRMMNIKNGVIVENDMKLIDLSREEFEKYKLVPGDILFNRTNSFELVGKLGIYRLEGEHVFASYLIRIRANSKKILAEYLNLYLNSDFGQRQIRGFIKPGVSQSNINAQNLKAVAVPLPPLDEQKRITRILLQIDEDIQRLHQHIERLKLTKQGLLNSLLNLEVNNV